MISGIHGYGIPATQFGGYLGGGLAHHSHFLFIHFANFKGGVGVTAAGNDELIFVWLLACEVDYIIYLVLMQVSCHHIFFKRQVTAIVDLDVTVEEGNHKTLWLIFVQVKQAWNRTDPLILWDRHFRLWLVKGKSVPDGQDLLWLQMQFVHQVLQSGGQKHVVHHELKFARLNLFDDLFVHLLLQDHLLNNLTQVFVCAGGAQLDLQVLIDFEVIWESGFEFALDLQGFGRFCVQGVHFNIQRKSFLN